MTAVIATHQRRAQLAQLVAELSRQVQAVPALGDGFDLVVVVDGSTDGTVEMLEQLDFPAPLKVIWQRNRGRSAARNAGLQAVTGEIVWFLDDDVIALPGLLRRHRLAHEQGSEHILMGPCPLVPSPSLIAPNKGWFDHIYEEMAATGVVDRADRFSSANTSGPVEMFRLVGGFDEGFTGWGCEDVEIGCRILDAGYDVKFDPAARAVHEQQLAPAQYCANNVANGRNLVRAIQLHPALIDQLLPVETALASRRRGRAIARSVYQRFPVRSPVFFRVVASFACSVARLEALVTRNRTQSALYVAMVASTMAGIAEADPSGIYLARKFGIVDQG